MYWEAEDEGKGGKGGKRGKEKESVLCRLH